MPEDDMEIFKHAMAQVKNNQENSPIVDDQDVPSPIAPSSQVGRTQAENQTEEEWEEEEEVEIEFSFFKCEECNEWKDGESMFMVETNIPILIKENEEGEEGEEIKTLKTEIQTWCAHCILQIIEKYKKEKQENVIERVEEEMAKIKDKRLKITRVQDKKSKQ